MGLPMLYRVLRALLFLLPAETAHDWGLRIVGWLGHQPWLRARVRRRSLPDLPELGGSRFGLTFAHPIGLAAGLDKTGSTAAGFFCLGFAFVEAGTFTPRPQAGNPKPRLYRIARDQALVNRMGFNNPGAASAAGSLASAWRPGPLGVNLGKNRDTSEDDAWRDYSEGLRAVGSVADYFVVNVSSPNTPGLRLLQQPDRLLPLLLATRKAADEVGRPLLVKISPDLEDEELRQVCDAAMLAGVAGIVACNTTLSRPETGGGYAQSGGVSGRPLKDRANRCLRLVHERTSGRVPLIGVGGLATGADVLERIRAGASLVQAYTGFIYGGPSWVGRTAHELAVELRRAGFRNLDEAVGSRPKAQLD
jgi:dihydroorotate dehydrogenase